MGNTYPHLSKAPITEALLDIRVVLPEGTTVEALAPFAQAVKSEFPEARAIVSVQATIGPAEAEPQPVQRITHGEIHWNAAKTRAVQGKLDGFTMNHVKVYDRWEVLREEAKKYWAEYVRATKPLHVVRCALRFINRIDVPTGVDLKQTFRTRIELSDSLSPVMEESFARVVVPFSDERSAAITQASQPQAVPDVRSVILDIDVFSVTRFEPSSDRLWEEFETLRDLKNRCFFESLTAEKVESYL